MTLRVVLLSLPYHRRGRRGRITGGFSVADEDGALMRAPGCQRCAHRHCIDPRPLRHRLAQLYQILAIVGSTFSPGAWLHHFQLFQVSVGPAIP